MIKLSTHIHDDSDVVGFFAYSYEPTHSTNKQVLIGVFPGMSLYDTLDCLASNDVTDLLLIKPMYYTVYTLPTIDYVQSTEQFYAKASANKHGIIIEFVSEKEFDAHVHYVENNVVSVLKLLKVDDDVLSFIKNNPEDVWLHC